MYDTDIALAMQEGKIEGIVDRGDYYLVNLRITGTGIKTRVIDGQEVEIDRPIEYFCSEHFLHECRGLPVTVEHPEERVNKDTFGECVIGSIFHPYIRGDEVWGVAKIYNREAIKTILTEEQSTSPNVISANLFFKADEPRVEDYESINHVAIVRAGFWDNGKPAIILKEGDMSEEQSSTEETKKEEKKDEASKEDNRDSVASSVRTDTEEKVDDESKEAKLAVEELDNRKEKEDSMEDKEKSDDLSKEAKVAESERDNRLEKDAEKELHEREKDKKDSDLYDRIAQLEAMNAELMERIDKLTNVEQKEGEEWDILANEHEELTDEHRETEAIEEEMVELRDALYGGVKESFKVLRASRREMPEKYMLRSVRANTNFLSGENKEIANILHPKTHKNAVRRLFAEFKDSVKQENIRSIGKSEADIPLIQKENGVTYDRNYLRRIFRRVGGKK